MADTIVTNDSDTIKETATMAYTPGYALPLPAESDNYNVEIVNEVTEKVDAALSMLKENKAPILSPQFRGIVYLEQGIDFITDKKPSARPRGSLVMDAEGHLVYTNQGVKTSSIAMAEPSQELLFPISNGFTLRAGLKSGFSKDPFGKVSGTVYCSANVETTQGKLVGSMPINYRPQATIMPDAFTNNMNFPVVQMFLGTDGTITLYEPIPANTYLRFSFSYQISK